MKELSLHITDIMQNSVAAGATLVTLEVNEQPSSDVLEFEITDNGCGMEEETLKNVTDPYTTGRTTRRVGLGIPLLKHAAESTGGSFSVKSKKGVGTCVYAKFGYSHIDREPLGDMTQTMLQIITSFEDTDFVYVHKIKDKEFKIDTRELKKILDGVSFKNFEVTRWLEEYLKENEADLNL